MNKITILAAIKTFYDSGKDLIDVFANLVLQIFEDDNKESLDSIQKNMKSKYAIDLPSDVLQTIIKRLRKNNFVEYSSLKTSSIALTPDGHATQKSTKEGLRSKERENNSLVEEIKKHIKTNMEENFTNQKITDELRIFIEESAEEAAFILTEGKKRTVQKEGIQKHLTDFFIEAENSDPINFERLKSILYGEIIASSLLQNKTEVNAKFKKLNIYLDSNIIFSLMELHEDVFNKPTKELINIIKDLDINLKIFNFTKEEVISTLRGYLEQAQYYSETIKVNSIYHVLKRKNYSKIDVISLIENIEEKLDELGIEIEYSFEINKLLADESELITKLQEKKPEKSPTSIKHDVAAIIGIKKLRGTTNSHLIEKSREIFLSADFRLTIFDSNEFDHDRNSTIPEVILRNQLTGILWLKKIKDDDNTFVHNILVGQLNDEFIHSSLWDKFISELKRQREKGEITNDDIDLLMSFKETESILKEKGESGIKEILSDERIKKKKEELQKKDQQQLEDEETIKKQQATIERVAKKIQNDCQIKWSMIINHSLWVFLLITIAIIISIFDLLEKSVLSWPFCISVFIVTLITLELRFKKNFMGRKITDYLPEWLEFPKVRSNFENRRIQKCVIKKKKKIDL